MNHLEQLIGEWLEFTGYFVRRNIKVGKLAHGGHACELDIVAYHPRRKRVLHIEPSIDSHTWPKREYRFRKKFMAGKKYIRREVFPWLSKKTKIEQWAVIMSGDVSKHKRLGGGETRRVSDIYASIASDLLSKAKKQGIAIPEQFMLLRTLQHGLRWIPEMSKAVNGAARRR
jgi:hypothetical protein